MCDFASERMTGVDATDATERVPPMAARIGRGRRPRRPVYQKMPSRASHGRFVGRAAEDVRPYHAGCVMVHAGCVMVHAGCVMVGTDGLME